MPKLIPTVELDALIEAASTSPEGVALENARALLPHLPSRTLQQRLSLLVRQGRLTATSKGPAVRYRPVESMTQRAVELSAKATARVTTKASVLPLSKDGVEILDLVDRPIALRTPVGYRRDFLDTYQPNRTRSLQDELCARLHELGRAPVDDRRTGTYARQIYGSVADRPVLVV